MAALKQIHFNMVKRQDLFKYIRRTMYCADMHPIYLERQLPHNYRDLGIWLELIFEIFLYFVTTHIAILYICTMYLNYQQGDLEVLVNSLMQAIIYLWTIVMKLYFRRWQRKGLKDLIKFINIKYQTRSAIGFTYVIMDDALAMSNKWFKWYLSSCFLSSIFWLILPITYGDRSLPLTCWYPFDYKQPVVYEMLYFLQSVGQIQVAAAFSASSGFYMVLSILISGQFDILFCSLKNIFATVAINRNATKMDLSKLYELQEFEEGVINEYYCSKEILCDVNTLIDNKTTSKERHDFRYHFRNALNNCTDHHCFIVDCLKKMDDFYSPIWFLKTGEVIFLMCLVAFVSVKSTTNSSFMKILSLGQYLLLVAVEMLLISYFGQMIYINSQRCGEALLRSPWYIYMTEIKCDFVIFLLSTKKPFQLSAGKMYALNIELFKSIMTTAFSFLTFLQNMYERNE